MIVLPEAVRSGYSFGHVGDPNPTPFPVNAAAPQKFTMSFPSTDWSNVANEGTLHLTPWLERSLDGGATWVGWVDTGGNPGTNVMGKGGVIPPLSLLVSWDGQAMLLRGSFTCGPAPFSVGVDLT